MPAGQRIDEHEGVALAGLAKGLLLVLSAG